MAKPTRDGIAPSPVYVATFADGSVGRLTFYSPKGKPIDIASGRREIATVWSRPEGAHYSTTHPPRKIAKGYVEWGNQTLPDDMSDKPVAPKPLTLKEILVKARSALECGDPLRAMTLLEAV